MRLHARLISSALLALNASAAMAAQESTAAPAKPAAQPMAAGQNGAPVRSVHAQSSHAKRTLVQLDQPGAIVMPPPILRSAGTTSAIPDRPLLGHLNLHGAFFEAPPGTRPPALQLAPDDLALARPR